MKTRTRLATLVCVLSLSATAFAQPVDLRGPAPVQGESLRTTTHVETEPGPLSMTMQGQQMQGQIQTTTDNATLLEFLEVDGTQVNKVRSTTEKNLSNSKMTLFGQTQDQAQGQEMEGVTLTMTRTDQGWDTEVGGTPVPQQMIDVLEQAGYVDPASMYPAQPVAVGESWKVSGQELTALMAAAGVPGSEVNGESSFTLTEVKVIDGIRTAVINYELNMAISMNMPVPGMDMKIDTDMVGKGQILRRLDNYTDTNTMEGSMVIQTEMKQGGQMMMEMNMDMPVKYTVQTERIGGGGNAPQDVEDAIDDAVEDEPALPRK